MKSPDVHILQDLVNAANDWQVQAAAENVVITILTTTIEGETVTLSWDATNNIWEIAAQ
jgi:hypothetical protein